MNHNNSIPKILEWRKEGRTLQSIGEELGITIERVRQLAAKGEDMLRGVEYAVCEISRLEISTRTINALISANITTIDKLLEYSEEDLLSFDGLGVNGVKEIKDELLNLMKSLQPSSFKNTHLEELILKCGEHFGALQKTPDCWLASTTFYNYTGQGKTPKEAVIDFLKELHKNNLI